MKKMKFNKNKLYTALNADKLKIGQKVIATNCIAMTKAIISEAKTIPIEFRIIKDILSEGYERRFLCDNDKTYSFVYLIDKKDELYVY